MNNVPMRLPTIHAAGNMLPDAVSAFPNERNMTMAVAGSNVLQIKVSLSFVRPNVWRRILVCPKMTLGELHEVLQIAMGWTNSHLHQFIKGRVYYGEPDEESGEETIDEKTVPLTEIFRRAKSSIVYEYDFGDGWDHRLVLEKILPAETAGAVPRCVAGGGACPPEDCGGAGGYAALLEALRDPKCDRHEEAVEFMPEGFDPAVFDMDAVNEELAAYGRGERPAIVNLFDDKDEEEEEEEWDDDEEDDELETSLGYVESALIETVNNQIQLNDPPETRKAFDRLKRQGVPAEEATDMIAEALAMEMMEVVQERKPMNLKRYVRNLERLPEQPAP